MKVQFTHHWFHELTLQQGHLDHGVNLNSLKPWFPKTGISSRFWLYQGLYKSSIKAPGSKSVPSENCEENGLPWNLNQKNLWRFFKLRCPQKKGSRSQLPGGVKPLFRNRPTFTPPKFRKKQQKNSSRHFSTTIGWWYIFWKIPPPWFWNTYM